MAQLHEALPSQPPSAHLEQHAQAMQCLSGGELQPPQAIQWLRDKGGELLANRLRTVARYHNSAAHPATGLLRDLRAAADRLSKTCGASSQDGRAEALRTFHPDQLRDDRVLRRKSGAQRVQPFGDGHVGAEPRHIEETNLQMASLETQHEQALRAPQPEADE